jgi:hypothetical protein
MQQNTELENFVNTQLQRGVKSAEIREQLLTAGWEVEVIDAVLNIQLVSSVADVADEETKPLNSEPVSIEGEPKSDNNTNIDDEKVLNQLEGIVEFSEKDVKSSRPIEQPIDTTYGVIKAVADAYTAIHSNYAAVAGFTLLYLIVPVIVSLAIPFFARMASIAVGGLIKLYEVVPSDAASIGIHPASLFGMVLLIGLILTFTFCLNAIVDTWVGLSINDGTEGRKSNIKQTFFAGIRRSPRVILASFLRHVFSILPMVTSFGLLLIFSPMMANLAVADWLFASILISGVIATVGIALRLILMPLVALFEPGIKPIAAMKRSNMLMKAGGVFFVLKIFLLITGISIIFSPILKTGIFTQFLPIDPTTWSTSSSYDSPVNLPSSLIGVFLYAFLYAVLVMLYRNRKAVKG